MKINRIANLIDMTILAVGKISQVGVGVAIISVATHMMRPEKLAIVIQVTSVFALVHGILSYPIITYFLRQLRRADEDGVLHLAIGQFLRWICAGALGAGLVVASLQAAIPFIPDMPPLQLGAAVTLYVVSVSLFLTGSGALNLFGYRSYFVACNLIAGIMGLILAPTLFVFSGHEPLQWAVGLSSGQLIAGLAFIFIISRSCRKDAQAHSTGELILKPRSVLEFTGIQSGAAALWWAQSQSYRFVLINSEQQSTAGLISSAQSISTQAIQAFSGIMTEFFMPRIMGQTTNDHDHIGRVINALFPATIVCTAYVMAVGPILATLFLAPSYSESSRIIRMTALLDGCWGIYNILYIACLSRSNMRSTLIPVALGGGLALALCPILVSTLGGLEGSLIALSISYGAMAGASMISLLRNGYRPDWKRFSLVFFIAAPFVVGSLFFSPGSGIIKNIAIFSLWSAYFAIAQLWLARSWLFTSAPIVE